MIVNCELFQDKLVNSMTKEDFESPTGPEDEVRIFKQLFCYYGFSEVLIQMQIDKIIYLTTRGTIKK